MIAIVEKGDISIAFTRGSLFPTKSSTNEYITLTLSDGYQKLSLILENITKDDGLIVSNHYTQDGILMANCLFENGKLVDIVVRITDDVVETVQTKARQEGESYLKCLARTYKEARKTLEENDVTNFICDFPTVGEVSCFAAATLYAAYECTN